MAAPREPTGWPAADRGDTVNDQGKGGQRRRADSARNRGASPPGAAAGKDKTAAARGGKSRSRELTITIPDRPVDAVMFPVAAARRVLSGRDVALPVYVGLGVLAVADVIDPPLAAVTGVGYAILRRWGPLRPAGGAPGGDDGRSAPGSEGKR